MLAFNLAGWEPWTQTNMAEVHFWQRKKSAISSSFQNFSKTVYFAFPYGHCEKFLFCIITFFLVRPLVHRHFVFHQNFIKSGVGRRFPQGLKSWWQLLQKSKINTAAEEGEDLKEWEQIQSISMQLPLTYPIPECQVLDLWWSLLLSYYFFKFKLNSTKFCTDA